MARRRKRRIVRRRHVQRTASPRIPWGIVGGVVAVAAIGGVFLWSRTASARTLTSTSTANQNDDGVLLLSANQVRPGAP